MGSGGVGIDKLRNEFSRFRRGGKKRHGRKGRRHSRGSDGVGRTRPRRIVHPRPVGTMRIASRFSMGILFAMGTGRSQTERMAVAGCASRGETFAVISAVRGRRWASVASVAGISSRIFPGVRMGQWRWRRGWMGVVPVELVVSGNGVSHDSFVLGLGVPAILGVVAGHMEILLVIVARTRDARAGTPTASSDAIPTAIALAPLLPRMRMRQRQTHARHHERRSRCGVSVAGRRPIMFERAEFVFPSRHGWNGRVSRMVCRGRIAFAGGGRGRRVVSSRYEERARGRRRCARNTRSGGGRHGVAMDSSFRRGGIPPFLRLLPATAPSCRVHTAIFDLVLKRQGILVQNALPGQNDRLSELVGIPTGFALADLRIAEDRGGEALAVEFEAFGFAAGAAFGCLVWLWWVWFGGMVGIVGWAVVGGVDGDVGWKAGLAATTAFRAAYGKVLGATAIEMSRRSPSSGGCIARSRRIHFIPIGGPDAATGIMGVTSAISSAARHSFSFEGVSAGMECGMGGMRGRSRMEGRMRMRMRCRSRVRCTNSIVRITLSRMPRRGR